jgi:RNA polymerase-binding transcription factor
MLKLLLLRKAARRRWRCRLDSPAARAVAVTGDFCGWDQAGRPLRRGRDGVWRTTLLLAHGRYEYRFLVDGQWADDPGCAERVPNGLGTLNCVLHVEARPPKPRRSPMTRKELDGYRKTLLALGARLDRNLSRDQRELMRDDEPDVPGGPLRSTEDEENDGLQEVELGLIANETGLLAEVTAAVRRIDAGTFGQCETCGKKIARTRLDTLPYARQCIRCARVAQAIPG